MAPGDRRQWRDVVLYWISAAILAWSSIWIFFFQDATRWQEKLLLLPVLSILGAIAVITASRNYRPGLWVYWFGATLVYVILSNAFNPSFFAFWKRTNDFLLIVALCIPILIALSQAAVSARILCGICLALSLASLLDNAVVELTAIVAGVVNTDPAAGGMQVEIISDRTSGPYGRSLKARGYWILFLAWLTLAAARPATLRQWSIVATVFVIAGLAIATGDPLGPRLAFVVSTGAFIAALWAPRFMRRFSVAALLALFLGAPILVRIVWLWFTGNWEIIYINDNDPVYRLRLIGDLDVTFPFDGTSSFVSRFFLWEYWAEIIGRRPWVGFGADSSLEFPWISLIEAFGARHDISLRMREYWFAMTLNFPHNFPLHIWLDFGVFGILIITGLVASLLFNACPTRQWDINTAARYALSVAVLVLFSLDRIAWSMPNLIQIVLTAGLAASTMNARDSQATAPLPGLTWRRERFLALALLLAGVVVAAGNSARVHLADNRYTPENTMLDLGRGVLHRGEEIKLTRNLAGAVDYATHIEGDPVTVSGWATDPATTHEVLQVLVFDDARLLGVTRTGRFRPDQQRISRQPNLDQLFSGFQLSVSQPPGWEPQGAVNAVFLSPYGQASIARVTEDARYEWENDL